MNHRNPECVSAADSKQIMLIVKEKLLTFRLNKCCFSNEIEIFCIELNFLKTKRANFLPLKASFDASFISN